LFRERITRGGWGVHPGNRSDKGDDIAKAYVRSADNPAANAFSFNILVGDPLIVVKGKTATR
jgi:hypothetical protein